MPIYKTTYRGRGIYYWPGIGYGDESRPYDPLCRSMPEARARIDAAVAQETAAESPASRYWATLPPAVRARYRRDPRIWEHDEGAAGVAYDDARARGEFEE